jgi:hypothetical protein
MSTEHLVTHASKNIIRRAEVVVILLGENTGPVWFLEGIHFNNTKNLVGAFDSSSLSFVN